MSTAPIRLYIYIIYERLPWPDEVHFIESDSIEIDGDEYIKFSVIYSSSSSLSGYILKDLSIASNVIPQFYEYASFSGRRSEAQARSRKQKSEIVIESIVDILSNQPFEKKTLEKAVRLLGLKSTNQSIRTYLSSPLKSKPSDRFMTVESIELGELGESVEVYAIYSGIAVYSVVFTKIGEGRISSIKVHVVDTLN